MDLFSITNLIIIGICLAFPIFHLLNSLNLKKSQPYYLKRKLSLNEESISILVPCYNEESIIETTIQGIGQLNYTNYELILINDGSTDRTFEKMKQLLDLELINKDRVGSLEAMPIKGIYKSQNHAKVIVIDKMNGGKADSLNAGISYAANDIVITLDADSILDEQALPIINRAFQDPNLIAAGGMVHVLQGRKYQRGVLKPSLKVKSIIRLQILDYFKGFYIYKTSLSKVDALSIISGAFGAFKRDVLISVGGYRKTVGEDIDITIKIQNYKNKRRNLKVIFIPEAICYTEVPESWGDLIKQRTRWQKAFTDCMVLYFKEFFTTFFKNPISFFLLADALFTGVICSILTVSSLTYIVLLNDYSPFVIFLLTLSLFINLSYSLISLAKAIKYGNRFSFKDSGLLVLTLFLDLFFFRLMLIYFFLIGTVQYFVNKEGWNKVARTGREYHIEQVG